MAITSNASGNYSVGATWVGGVAPADTDDAIIATGHAIAMDARIPATGSLASLTFQGTGSLTVDMTAGLFDDPGSSVNVTGAITAGSDSTGAIKISGADAAAIVGITSATATCGTGSCIEFTSTGTLNLSTDITGGISGSREGVRQAAGTINHVGSITGGSGGPGYSRSGGTLTVSGNGSPATVASGGVSGGEAITSTAGVLIFAAANGGVNLVNNAVMAVNGLSPVWNITDKSNYISMLTVNASPRGSQAMRFYLAPKAVEVQEDIVGGFEDGDDPPNYSASGSRVDCPIASAKSGVTYGDPDEQLTGTLIVGGTASYEATLAKETGAETRGGSGTCAKLTPTSTTEWGYFDFYIPCTTGVQLILNFYHKISSGWNGLLKVTIYDTDQSSELLSSESVSLTDDDAYHLYTATGVTPTDTGLCRVSIEIKDGSTTGYVYLDDLAIT